MEDFNLNAYLNDAQVTEMPAMDVAQEAIKKGPNRGLIFGLGLAAGVLLMKVTEYVRYEYGDRSLRKLCERFVPQYADFDPDATFEESETNENDTNENN